MVASAYWSPVTRYSKAELAEAKARKSLKAFTQRMFSGYTTSAHILMLIDAIEWTVNTPGARLIIDMPPRHSKSLHVSENLPAWYLGRFPDNRVIGASHTASLANTFSRRVRNKLVNPRYPFAGVKIAGDKAAVQAWDIEGHLGGYYSVGVGGSPAGVGANLIIVDDPVKNAADAESQTARDALWEWWKGDIRTRLEPGGSIIVTATRWHEDDLIGRLLGAKGKDLDSGWRHIHMPALAEPDDILGRQEGEPLWPERWSAKELQSLKEDVGTKVWTSLYQGAPTPPDGGMFKDWWWQRYTSLPKMTSLQLVLDSAFKDGVGNDYSVFALWGSDGLGSSYLINLWRQKVQYPDLMRLAHTAYAWTKQEFPGVHVSLVIEDKASGQSALQTLKKPYPTMDGTILPALPIVAYPVKATESKTSRAEGITPIVEGGRAFIPQSAPWLADWIDEHQKFPNGAHDDCVDTSVMGIARTQRGRGGLA